MRKTPRLDAKAFAQKGALHRTTAHLERTAAQSTHETKPSKAIEPTRRGGRPRAFEGETVKVALFLPPDLAGDLKAYAARQRQTPSALVADWIHKAELFEAIARVRQDFVDGNVISHEEILKKLSKFS